MDDEGPKTASPGRKERGRGVEVVVVEEEDDMNQNCSGKRRRNELNRRISPRGGSRQRLFWPVVVRV